MGTLVSSLAWIWIQVLGFTLGRVQGQDPQLAIRLRPRAKLNLEKFGFEGLGLGSRSRLEDYV